MIQYSDTKIETEAVATLDHKLFTKTYSKQTQAFKISAPYYAMYTYKRQLNFPLQ
jgi:hypothetical protein